MVNNNGMGYNMNLVPQGYADGGNGGMFGGNWMWFLLVWMAMFGWGNGGFGFGGNNGGGYVSRDGGNSYSEGFSRGYSEAMRQSGHYPMPDGRMW